MPIAEPTSTTNILAIPRLRLEETIVIPAATQCTEYRAACKEIQHIEQDKEETLALEEYTLKALNPLSTITPEEYLASSGTPYHTFETQYQNGEQQQPFQEPFPQWTEGSRNAKHIPAGPSVTGSGTTPIFPCRTTCEIQHLRTRQDSEGPGPNEWHTAATFPISTLGRLQNNGTITKSGWEIQGRTVYSENVPNVLSNSSSQDSDPLSDDSELLQISPIDPL